DTAALCEVKGWTPAGYYIDNDRSASNGKQRPEWDRLLADIKAGRIDAIAGWDQDRNWRLMSELEQLREYFAKLGRKILLATTGQGEIDLYSPTGVLAAQIKTAVSEHEIAMMKVRQRRAHRQKAESGKPQWKQAFGYLPDTRRRAEDDGTRQIDPVTAPLVAEAYRMLLRGGSLKEIARYLNDAKAYGLNGKPWSESTVSLFLRAARNAGLRSHNGEVVTEGTWPALVDVATWKTAQAKLSAPSRAPGRKSVQKHPLTGVMRCAECGHWLSGQWVMQAKKDSPRSHSITYACRGCRKVSVRAEHAEPILYGTVGGRLSQPDAVDLLQDACHDEAAAEAARAELSALYAQLDSFAVEHAEGLLTARQLKVSSDVVQAKIDDLERAQQSAERLRIFDGIPLGRPEAADAIRQLSADRFKSVLGVLATVTVAGVGKGGHTFKADRIQFDWR
ncbi:MAG: recombinase family protein, partial [Mycobacterium sp.]